MVAEMNAVRLIVLFLIAVSSYGEGSNQKQYCIVGAGPGGKFHLSLLTVLIVY